MNKKMFFDMHAKKWDNFIDDTVLKRIEKKIIPKLKIKNSDKIIDIGCGTGIMIPFLLKIVGKKGKIVAMDY